MTHRLLPLLLILLFPFWAHAQSAPKKSAPKPAAAAKATALAAGTAAAAALTDEQRNVIPAVHTGRMACDLQAVVTIEADAQHPGLFRVHGQGFHYYMTPVVTSTGAVRLEDAHAGAVWLQIPSKSMLMKQKLGRRLADGCQSAQQIQVATADKDTPQPDLLAAPDKKAD